MWRWKGAMLLLILSLVPLRAALPAQEQEGEPAPAAVDESARYVPPPAWKSVEIGNYYLKRKKIRGALGRFQEAIKTDPHYAPAYLGLGKVYEKMGLRQKALDAYRRYLDELPSTKQALEAKDAQKAVARLEKQLKPRAKSGRGPSPQR